MVGSIGRCICIFSQTKTTPLGSLCLIAGGLQAPLNLPVVLKERERREKDKGERVNHAYIGLDGILPWEMRCGVCSPT